MVVPEARAQETLEALHGMPLQGKRIRISITNETPELNNSRRGGGNRSERSFGGGHDRGGARNQRRRSDGGRNGNRFESREHGDNSMRRRRDR